MSDAETITAIIVGFFVLLAVLTFLRLLFRKGPPHWNQLRLGVYIERVPNPDWEEKEEALATKIERHGGYQPKDNLVRHDDDTEILSPK